uniref:Uncharacterized protein n=1 Tax=Lactuca sativa TaxID=4236 RepID=A0A9R1XM86_LACSA|nr:hypothetical protein LSAT_V11C200059260 [Lactuca sativa]
MSMQTTPQGEFESLHRDLIIAYGKWEFDPMELEDSFPNNEGSVQIWMGDNDDFVPVALRRYIAQKLPWIKYHEIPSAGHIDEYGNESHIGRKTKLNKIITKKAERMDKEVIELF